MLEHHSNLSDEEDRDKLRSPALWRRRVLAENRDAPVVFTTSAQVLEALFGAGTRPVRRLHAMSRAVVVFDEVQTLPIRMVHLFNNAINFLASHCGSTIVLCTATQPLLASVDTTKGAAKLSDPPELAGNVRSLFERLKRYEVFDHTAQIGGWTIPQVASLVRQEARDYGSCLTILNTKRDTRELFSLLRGEMPSKDRHFIGARSCSLWPPGR